MSIKSESPAWIVIEINDGQRAGLSEFLAGDLYPAMDRVLRQRGA